MAVKNGVALNWGGFDKVVGKASSKMGDTKKALMASIGEALVSSTLKRFDAEEGPDGKPWQPSKRAAAESGKTLTNTAELRKSIGYAATASKVMVGSKAGYARIHQMGGKAGKGHKLTVPARPYLGVSKEDMEEVKAILAEFLAGTFKA
ncbi:phage virion morphogenesis protein [uncultured Desulfovibrio sp.]|uniref:phage virion morphogenesis protein n=1 Tax=uncultured Desulfovibrio sp. TaxID=167968 RepID=UPI00266FBEA9|nr:phage virion morphogenesis protein [uncultured Desulfovibrio sp.]